MSPDIASRRQHVGKIGRAILPRRSTHGDELHLTVANALGDIRRETDAPGCAVAPDQRVQSGFEDGHMTLAELLDLRSIDVQAEHVVTHVSETGSGDQPDIAATNHRYAHDFS
jgi:hypothetical protein